jgi:hypothetical protein
MFNKNFNQAAGLNTGQAAGQLAPRQGSDYIELTPAGALALRKTGFNRPVYLWSVVAVEAAAGPYSPVLEEVDSTVTFIQAVKMSQALNELERARGLQRRYCVRRASAPEPAPVEVADITF